MEWPREGAMRSPQRPEHKRNKSSVLRSIMSPGKSKRLSPEEENLRPVATTKLSKDVCNPYDAVRSMPVLPLDHPHVKTILGELHQNQGQNTSPKKKYSDKEGRPSNHKKAYSALSIKSLGKKEGKGIDDEGEELQGGKDHKLKKSKSSTSISAMFKSSRGRDRFVEPRDKENTTPTSSASGNSTAYAPIWAQFATTPQMQGPSTTTTVPLNDHRTVADEIALYTPLNYSPSKQRPFDNSQPTLGRRGDRKERPKSAIFFSSSSKSFSSQTMSRKSSTDSKEAVPAQANATGQDKPSKERTKSRSRARSLFRPSSRRERTPSHEQRKISEEETGKNVAGEKGRSKVMAAVAALNDKAKEAELESKVNPKDIDKDFEAVLDARNIPENMRAKMRSLDLRIKQDFIKQHRQEHVETPMTPKTPKLDTSRFAIWDDCPSKTSAVTEIVTERNDNDVKDDSDIIAGSPNKRSRPRSKTFAGSKGDPTPSKRHKYTTSKDGSVSIPHSPSTRSLGGLTGNGSTDALVRTPKPAMPEEFVAYLREVHKPQTVEIGKLHKLRLLLRNETVSWVNSFISQGGMTEIVGLLHRIMEVEWREEHEDTLLHETLLCLKGLCTTSLGLRNLCTIENSLFPALLAMLFDEERKGPSDFTTRAIIIHIIFTHIASATPSDARSRARTILSYLADPKPDEAARPVGFILDMHQSRPYRVWCKEIVGVTKEVFWIFLHHLNVVPIEKPTPPPPTTPLPSSSSSSSSSSNGSSESSYRALYFPPPRPPVPAAPYIGGVEWDATSYLATHLDLLNGIIASLPTSTERNKLREELKASGFEKVMGTSLRTCKEKFYGAVHAGLRTWVAAAVEDGWNVDEVREGPPREREKEGSPRKGSPVKSPVKGKGVAMGDGEPPKLSLGLGKRAGNRGEAEDEGGRRSVGKAGGERVDDEWL